MSYKFSHKPNHTVEVDAELDAEAVARERDHIIRKYRGHAQVPGFRPGKAPESAVRARFADDIEEELREHLVNHLLHEVFTGEEGFEPITSPKMGSLEFAQDGGFHFTAEMEVRPRYELPEIEDAELPEVSLDVADAEVEEELRKVADEHSSWEPADEATIEDGLLVEADLHGVMEDSDEEPFEELGAQFIVGHESVPPQISEALQGAKVGEERIAEKRFPDDDENTNRAGKTVRYTAQIKAVKRKVLPEIDDELAKTIGLESLDELKDRIAQMLERNKLIQRREDWRRFLLDHVERDIDVNELPSSLVQTAVREDMSRFAYSMAMQGVAPDSNDVDWQEMSARMEPGSRRRVLDTLVLEQLAEAWEIKVPEAEVDAYVIAEAQRLNLPPGEHKANLAKEKRLDDLRHSARMSSTIDEMIRRAGGEVK